MKVVIKNESGHYLTLKQGEPAFDPRKERAVAYDYLRDRVEDQIRNARSLYGVQWTWEELGDTSVVDGLPSARQ